MELTDPLAELTPLDDVGPVDGEDGLDPFAVAGGSPFTLPPPALPSAASSSKLTQPDLAGDAVLLPPAAVSSAIAEG